MRMRNSRLSGPSLFCTFPVKGCCHIDRLTPLAIIRRLESAELLMEIGPEIPMAVRVGLSEVQFGEYTKSSLELRSLDALQL